MAQNENLNNPYLSPPVSDKSTWFLLYHTVRPFINNAGYILIEGLLFVALFGPCEVYGRYFKDYDKWYYVLAKYTGTIVTIVVLFVVLIYSAIKIVRQEQNLYNYLEELE